MPEPDLRRERDPAREPASDPGEPEVDHLRALVREREPRARELLDDLVATWLAPVRGRWGGVVVAAVVLGVAGWVAVRATTEPVDPVAVLPRATQAGQAAVPGGGGPAGPGGPVASAPPASAAPPGTDASRIRVHAAGAVAVPGVHELRAGARVEDLIRAAGGLAPDADADRINLAAPVADGERVYVPRRGEADPPPVVASGGPPPSSASTPSDGDAPGEPPGAPVDLNRADAAALDALPGIGPATAEAIVRHRAEHGPFTSVDQLQDVTGIGPAKLARLRDLVRV